MDQIIIYIVLTIFLPIAMLIVFLEKRARRVMLSFLCGVLICLAAYHINTFLYETTGLRNEKYSFTFGALAEESLKFIPLLIFCLFIRKGKRQTIAMSFALGVGFCVVENFFYLINTIDDANLSWIFIRCIGTGLMHAISASSIGYGLYRARTDENKNPFVVGAITYIIAVLYHALFNFLTAIEEIKTVGVLLPFISYILLFVFIKKDKIKAFFEEEEKPEEKTNKMPKQ